MRLETTTREDDMEYTATQREQIKVEARGKTVQELNYDEEDKYWFMTFTDGSEISFRFMSELISHEGP